MPRVQHVDRVAGHEGATDAGDAGGQQGRAALDHGSYGAGVERERALPRRGVRQPQQPGRATLAGGLEEGADLGAGERRRAWSAEVSTTSMPAPVAMRAASTLVVMPPVPTPEAPVEPMVTPARSASDVHHRDQP